MKVCIFDVVCKNWGLDRLQNKELCCASWFQNESIMRVYVMTRCWELRDLLFVLPLFCLSCLQCGYKSNLKSSLYWFPFIPRCINFLCIWKIMANVVHVFILLIFSYKYNIKAFGKLRTIVRSFFLSSSNSA